MASALIAAAIFGPIAAAAAAPASGGMIFDRDNVPKETSWAPSSGDTVSYQAGEHGGLVASYAQSAQYPGIAFPAPDGHEDLSKFAGVKARIYNPSSAQITVNLRVDNDNGGDWSKVTYDAEFVKIDPGQTAVLPVKFGESWGHAGYALDPSRVTQILLYASGGAGGSFVLEYLRAVPQADLSDPGAAGQNVVPETLPANPAHNRFAKPETVGEGSLEQPAIAPPPAYDYGHGFVCVKNWDFGTKGTIKNIADMNANFMYHDQFGTIRNPNYGAVIVAPDQADALPGQPIVGAATGGRPVRQFLPDGLKTFVVPLDGATTLSASEHNAGSGSFQAKWTLPSGGILLGHDILWETRVRMVTPPYFWMSIWCSGNKWDHGAEMDLIEDFGYDNGPGATNYNGDNFHSNSAGGTDTSPYGNWGATMASYGIANFDASQWHTWAWLYRKDDTYEAFVDGRLCQTGKMHWTLACKPDGEYINMSFLFDGSWGSPTVKNDDFPLPASALANTYYEWGYSRVYLR